MTRTLDTRIRRTLASWWGGYAEPSQDHLRFDIGLPPLRSVPPIPVLVFAWLH